MISLKRGGGLFIISAVLVYNVNNLSLAFNRIAVASVTATLVLNVVIGLLLGGTGSRRWGLCTG